MSQTLFWVLSKGGMIIIPFVQIKKWRHKNVNLLKVQLDLSFIPQVPNKGSAVNKLCHKPENLHFIILS